METKTETIRSQALTLTISTPPPPSQLDTLLHAAEQRDMTHMEFL